MLSIIWIKASRRMLDPPPSGARLVSSMEIADGPESFRRRSGRSTTELNFSFMNNKLFLRLLIWSQNWYFKYSHDPEWSDASRAEANSDLSAIEPRLSTFDWSITPSPSLLQVQHETHRLTSCTLFSPSLSDGAANWGVRPGSVGKKKGAAAGAAGGATGLFLLCKQMVWSLATEFISCEFNFLTEFISVSANTCGRGFLLILHDVIRTHLDHVQMQQAFPSRLRQQRERHKLRPQLLSWLKSILYVLWTDFLFWLLRGHTWQGRLRWLVVSWEGSEANRPT